MSVMKVWNGSTWVKPFFAYPKIWNGSAWVYGRPRMWTGGGWSMPPNDLRTVTVGSGIWSQEYIGSGTAYGYNDNGFYNTSFGSVSPNRNTDLVDEGGYFARIVYESGSLDGQGPYWIVWLQIYFNNITVQYNPGDWGWNTLNIGGYTYSRSTATYTGSKGYSEWTWNLTSSDPNPFGTTVGATKTVTFS